MIPSRTRRRLLHALAAGGALGRLGATAAEERFPTRVIKIQVGTPAGGSFDMAARPLANQLSARLGQPVILENRPGANQLVATVYTAKAPADGYTLLLASDANISLAPALPAPLPYDSRRDFVPLAIINHLSMMMVTHPANPIVTLADLVARAKAAPGRISYASLGIGSIPHIAMEVFSRLAGIELLHVPYQGTAPAVTATLAREVDFTFASIGVSLPYVPERLRPVALAGRQRYPSLPQVPTFIESGFADFEVRAWFGLFAPRRTPESVVQLLQREIWAVASSREYIEGVVRPQAAEPSSVPPERLESFLNEDRERWVDWVKSVRARVNLN